MRQIIIGQPHGPVTLADWLRDKLKAGACRQVTFAVAMVTDDGLDELWSELWVLLNNPGSQFTVYVGIDLDTTESALQRLLSLPNTSVYIIHDGSNTVTYHPKAYIMECSDQAAIAIGSANLTHAGLNTNLELTVAIELDLPAEMHLLQQIKSVISTWANPATGACQQLTPHLLNQLTSSGAVAKAPTPSRHKPAAPSPTGAPLFNPITAARQPMYKPRFFFMTVTPGDLPARGSSPEIKVTKYVKNLQPSFWGAQSSYTYNSQNGSYTRRVTVVFGGIPMDAELRDLPARKPSGTKASADFRLGNIGALWWSLQQADDIVMLERLDRAATRYRAGVIRVGSAEHSQLYPQMQAHPRSPRRYLYV